MAPGTLCTSSPSPPLLPAHLPPALAPAGNINQLVLKLPTYCAELHRHGGVIAEFVNPKSVFVLLLLLVFEGGEAGGATLGMLLPDFLLPLPSPHPPTHPPPPPRTQVCGRQQGDVQEQHAAGVHDAGAPCHAALHCAALRCTAQAGAGMCCC